jgi:hypothetical protein
MAGFCSSCGKELPDTSVRFCEYCGSAITPVPKTIEPDVIIPQSLQTQNAKRIASPDLHESISNSTKKTITPKIIAGSLIMAGIIILAIIVLFGGFSIPSLPPLSSDDQTKGVEKETTITPIKGTAEMYQNIPDLPKGMIILGQIQGPIPGRQVEFVFEAGPDSGMFKSWKAVLIAPDGTFVESQDGRIVRNELIILQGKTAGTYTGMIIASSYTGQTYKVVERKITFRG